MRPTYGSRLILHTCARTWREGSGCTCTASGLSPSPFTNRSEEHTSELQSPCNLVCRLLLEKSRPPTTFSGGSLSFISVPLSVASNATPGLRSLVVQRGTDFAYANGFLKAQTIVPDCNCDGL